MTRRGAGIRVFVGLLIAPLGVVMCAMNPWPARAEDAPPDYVDDIEYTILEGDNLYLVATQYYNAPSASAAIFEKNKGTFKKACEQAKSRRCGSDTIYPGTIILLPSTLASRSGVLYDRRGSPMERGIAVSVANNKQIDLEGLGALSQRIRPADVPLPKSPPLLDYPDASGPEIQANRERQPDWHKSPSTDLQRCAKAVCARFKSLCYFECLAVAKRLDDGGVSCKALPRALPYDFDFDVPDRCGALTQ